VELVRARINHTEFTRSKGRLRPAFWRLTLIKASIAHTKFDAVKLLRKLSDASP
jgi:hypothetical protein